MIWQITISNFQTQNLILSQVRSEEFPISVFDQHLLNKVYLCDKEVRKAVKDSIRPDLASIITSNERFTIEWFGSVTSSAVLYQAVQTTSQVHTHVPMYQNPTISGLRVPQIATGAFLKLNCILNLLNFEPRDIICGGDGSGGMSACLLRKYKTS